MPRMMDVTMIRIIAGSSWPPDQLVITVAMPNAKPVWVTMATIIPAPAQARAIMTMFCPAERNASNSLLGVIAVFFLKKLITKESTIAAMADMNTE